MDARTSLRAAVQRSIEMDAPLEERLAAYARASALYAPQFTAPIEALVARLRQSGAGASAPMPGQPMPPFALSDQDGALVTLDDLLAEGPVALVFDRGHWCPYCRINMAALAQADRAIRTLGGRLVAVTPERAPYARRMQERAGGVFQVLSDLDNGYALSIGLAFWMGTELRDLYAAIGVRAQDYQGNDAWMMPIPATFVVGSDGIVTQRFIEPDYRRRMAVDDLVAAVAAAAQEG